MKTKEVTIQGEQFGLKAALATKVLELYSLRFTETSNRSAALLTEDRRFLNRELLALCSRIRVVDGLRMREPIPDLWDNGCVDPLASEPGKLAQLLGAAFKFGVEDPLADGLLSKAE